MESANVRIDEKFRIEERIVDYNLDDEVVTKPRDDETFLETKNDLQNDVQTIEKRGEQRYEPREEIRVEMSAPTHNRNLTRNHPPEKIIGSKDKDVMTRNKVNEEICLRSQVEPKCIDEAIKDDHWIREMEEEPQQVIKNDTWKLVTRPKEKNVIGTKWVFRNKLNEDGKVLRNKARLV